jgi:hypothetical protein
MLLEFKTHSLIYCNLLLKVIDLIISGSLKPIKIDYFVGVRSSTTNHQLHEL